MMQFRCDGSPDKGLSWTLSPARSPQSTEAFPIGERVLVQWKQDWYSAFIAGYDGHTKLYNVQWTDDRKISFGVPAGLIKPSEKFAPGDLVYAPHGNKYYKAMVVRESPQGSYELQWQDDDKIGGFMHNVPEADLRRYQSSGHRLGSDLRTPENAPGVRESGSRGASHEIPDVSTIQGGVAHNASEETGVEKLRQEVIRLGEKLLVVTQERDAAEDEQRALQCRLDNTEQQKSRLELQLAEERLEHQTAKKAASELTERLRKRIRELEEQLLSPKGSTVAEAVGGEKLRLAPAALGATEEVSRKDVQREEDKERSVLSTTTTQHKLALMDSGSPRDSKSPLRQQLQSATEKHGLFDPDEFGFEDAAKGKTVLEAAKEALAAQEGYIACTSCGTVMLPDNKERHAQYHDRKREEYHAAEYVPLTAELYVEMATKFSPKFVAIGLYSMHGPLCYEVNTSMRAKAFEKKDTLYKHTKSFCGLLHKELLDVPEHDGSLFRAVNYDATKDYVEDSVQVMPQPTSTTTSMHAMKAFIGKDAGTVLMYKSTSGRPIKEYSKYPMENECLLPTGTAFRVQRTHKQVVDFVNSAMEQPYGVKVVLLTEISPTELQEELQTAAQLKRTLKLVEGLEQVEKKPVLKAVELALGGLTEDDYCFCTSYETCKGHLKGKEARLKHDQWHKSKGLGPATYSAPSAHFYYDQAQKISPVTFPRDAEFRPEFKMAVRLYTAPGLLYAHMNDTMREFALTGIDKHWESIKPYASLFHHEILSIEPKPDQILFRGINVQESWGEGHLHVTASPKSMTDDPKLALEWVGIDGGTLMIFRTQSARFIAPYSVHPEEREYLIPAGTAFRVKPVDSTLVEPICTILNMDRGKKITVFVLNEIAPDDLTSIS
eukprot:Hpha_TRINITY_DN16689_c2_g1::TRINITY_DN16689_c2_g1_i2::g.182956::m.182956